MRREDQLAERVQPLVYVSVKDTDKSFVQARLVRRPIPLMSAKAELNANVFLNGVLLVRENHRSLL